MPRNRFVLLGVFVLILLGGWAAAQQGPANPPALASPAPRYAVAPAGEVAVLLDTASGKSWLLNRPTAQGEAVWLPIPRIDDATEAAQWRDQDAVRAAKMAEQIKAQEAEELERLRRRPK
jgi:hypothetical protein